MDNNNSTLGDILDKNYFIIPEYQRAYAWGETQLNDFINDLKNHRSFSSKEKPYFLGTFLFSTESEAHGVSNFSVVDGQQRLTTSILYASCALKVLDQHNINTNELKSLFIGDSSCRRLQAIMEDNLFFDQYVLEGNHTHKAETPSQKKLQQAVDIINKKISDMPSENKIVDIEKDLNTLINSRILTYTVHSESEATQIFEFQNDRGKKLTDLEVIKSFLMHSIYIFCADKRKTEGVLRTIQSNFTKIYRTIEIMSDFEGKIREDTILAYHIISYLPYTKLDNERYGWSHPKEFIKHILTNKKSDNAERISWIENFSKKLLQTFDIVRNILIYRDEDENLGGLFILNRVAPFWPLLIKGWDCDKSPQKIHFREIVKYCSRFSFRSSIANLRSDTGVEQLRRDANQFTEGKFEDLKSHLAEMCESWWNIKNRFLQGLDERNFYGSGIHVKYLLWKYENYLRSRSGRHAQHALTWKDMIEKKGTQLQMTVDHIIPQHPSDPIEQAILEKEVIWEDGDQPETFRKVYLHRLGNLVLDTRAGNSSNGCRRFSQKTDNSRYGFMQSQDELKTFSHNMEVWDEKSIKERQEILKDFSIKL